jgi:hypothetical protein
MDHTVVLVMMDGLEMDILVQTSTNALELPPLYTTVMQMPLVQIRSHTLLAPVIQVLLAMEHIV